VVKSAHLVSFSVLLGAAMLVAQPAAAQNPFSSLFQSAPMNTAPAENVPLPRPAPKGRDSAAANDIMRPPGAISGATGTSTAPAARANPAMPMAQASPPPTPVLPDRSARTDVGPAGFTPEQRQVAARVSAYLSSLQSLTGNFVQVGPDGGRTTGEFFIQKPGKVRFEYDPPSRIAIVADGSSVIVRDKKLATQDLFPLSQTPLRFLLSDRIDLLRDTNLVRVTADDTYISVALEENQPLIGKSRLMLMIGAKDLQLKQWTVTDPQGYDTTVAVYNLDPSKKLDPGLFRIDYTTYQTPNTAN
jgi:outer membrane lipoprotein-sorting protein